MKSTKVYNNFSAEFLKQIPKLKPGEVKTFQMLNGVPNPDPDPREVAKEPMVYGKRQLITNFRVYDQWQKDESGNVIGGYVDCGAVERWGFEGRPEKHFMIVPGSDMGSRFQGKFSLTGGNVRDEELWEILYISPEREGTPCPDNSIMPLFKVLDVKADSRASVTKFDIISKAIDIAKKLKADNDEKGARSVMAALNQPTYQDADTLFAKVKELATTKPDLFIQTFENKETPVMGVLREALEAQVIDHDNITGKITMGGVTLTIIKTETTESFLPSFAKWIGSAANGKDVLSNIKKQLEKKAEPVA